MPEKVKLVCVRSPLDAGGFERRIQHLFSQPVRIPRLAIDPTENEVIARYPARPVLDVEK